MKKITGFAALSTIPGRQDNRGGKHGGQGSFFHHAIPFLPVSIITETGHGWEILV
ncbi:MAG: hypothetical protein QGG19_12050 [Alphaproteobacteria bacterium]|nr:hypothetical protein [Alphaproteobacteria bacterium]MDP6256525.1 hypothetical protein [Alphaproteobacteria bacterium]MDP7056486.1 hypothetical protein [Alphaproteobacteria bacterium]MDP7230407.1 hypothetical protein [Alphaproteobacteria bacterium]MDP7458985.1 hypothetical protein [Alphaproteobacteria bacterium]